jgi:hypothetical protein
VKSSWDDLGESGEQLEFDDPDRVVDGEYLGYGGQVP